MPIKPPSQVHDGLSSIRERLGRDAPALAGEINELAFSKSPERYVAFHLVSCLGPPQHQRHVMEQMCAMTVFLSGLPRASAVLYHRRRRNEVLGTTRPQFPVGGGRVMSWRAQINEKDQSATGQKGLDVDWNDLGRPWGRNIISKLNTVTWRTAPRVFRKS